MRQHCADGQCDLGSDTGRQFAVGVRELQFNRERSGGVVGHRRDVTHPSLRALARGQLRGARHAFARIERVLLGDAGNHHERAVVDERCHFVAGGHVVADFDLAILQRAVERRANLHALDVQLRAAQRRPRRFQFRRRLRQQGVGHVAFRLELELPFVFEFTLPHPGPGLFEPRRTLAASSFTSSAPAETRSPRRAPTCTTRPLVSALSSTVREGAVRPLRFRTRETGSATKVRRARGNRGGGRCSQQARHRACSQSRARESSSTGR
ncbi:MAG: hypothetical protein HC872_00830 [Gammaproteobacteria bacterium]|nr:hypothetical protein [Gammaproteobacteria bacterium]